MVITQHKPCFGVEFQYERAHLSTNWYKGNRGIIGVSVLNDGGWCGNRGFFDDDWLR